MNPDNMSANGYTVLIVDDQPSNLHLLSQILMDQGYTARAVMNGPMAITSARIDTPDIILLDINMPNMDGYEVCRRLKQDPQTNAIPVIFVSAFDEVLNKVEAFQVGGVDYVTRPFQVEEILARVNTHLTLQRMQQQLQEQNAHLQQEIAERTRAEEALQRAHDELEMRVQERTARLSETNRALQDEMAERTRTEEAYRTLVDHSLQGLTILQNDRVIFANPTASTITGYTNEELLSFPQGGLYTMLHPDDRPTVLERQHNRHIGKSEPSSYEYRIIRKDGSIRWIEVSIVMTCYQDKPATQAAFIDITERKQAEEKLRESEERYRTLVETSPGAILMTDMDGTIQFCNQQTAHTFGYERVEDLYHRRGIELVAPDALHQSQARMIMKPETIRNIEYTMVRQDGSRFPAEISSSVVTNAQHEPKSLVIIVQDISERKLLQARLIETERFAASGRLAASVAHEINTPLQAIQTFLKLAQVARQPEEISSFVEHAYEEIQYVGKIVRQLLDLYRPGASQDGPIDIGVILERIALLIGKRLREQRVILEQQLSSTIPVVYGRADEMMQVLLNLMVNALDAMPDGGTIQIRTDITSDASTRSVSDNGGPGDPESTPPQWLLIEVRDTGCGISTDLQPQIFEPFVTTKEQGTGLGLAISSQIIQQHSGHIRIESRPGYGSTFTILLPVES